MKTIWCLLLLARIFIFSIFTSLLGTNANKTSISTSLKMKKFTIITDINEVYSLHYYLAQCSESLEFLLVLRNFTEFNDRLFFLNGHNFTLKLSGQLAFFKRRFALSDLLLIDREKNQFALIFLQALDIALTGFNRLVFASAIHSNTNSFGKTSWNTSSLKRRKWCLYNIKLIYTRKCECNLPSILPR